MVCVDDMSLSLDRVIRGVACGVSALLMMPVLFMILDITLFY